MARIYTHSLLVIINTNANNWEVWKLANVSAHRHAHTHTRTHPPRKHEAGQSHLLHPLLMLGHRTALSALFHITWAKHNKKKKSSKLDHTAFVRLLHGLYDVRNDQRPSLPTTRALVRRDWVGRVTSVQTLASCFVCEPAWPRRAPVWRWNTVSKSVVREKRSFCISGTEYVYSETKYGKLGEKLFFFFPNARSGNSLQNHWRVNPDSTNVPRELKSWSKKQHTSEIYIHTAMEKIKVTINSGL